MFYLNFPLYSSLIPEFPLCGVYFIWFVQWLWIHQHWCWVQICQSGWGGGSCWPTFQLLVLSSKMTNSHSPISEEAEILDNKGIANVRKRSKTPVRGHLVCLWIFSSLVEAKLLLYKIKNRSTTRSFTSVKFHGSFLFASKSGDFGFRLILSPLTKSRCKYFRHNVLCLTV